MEKERGVICLDLGHSYTTAAGYLNGSIIYMKSIEQGFKQVIKDIAQVFHTSFDEAERLLNSYGKIVLKEKISEQINYIFFVFGIQNIFKLFNSFNIASVMLFKQIIEIWGRYNNKFRG